MLVVSNAHALQGLPTGGARSDLPCLTSGTRSLLCFECIFCDEVILENGRENGFCKLLQEVTSFSISKAAEDTLRLDMNIAGVWQAT